MSLDAVDTSHLPPTLVVVGGDASEGGRAAARRAGELFGSDARYVVAHVLVPPVPGVAARTADPMVYQALERAKREEGSDALAATAEAVGHPAEQVLVPGDPGSALCGLAAKCGADVLVVGSRGTSGLRRAVLGSTSLHLVNNAPCPVLVVRRELGDEDATTEP